MSLIRDLTKSATGTFQVARPATMGGANETTDNDSVPVLNVPVIDIGALMACKDDAQVDATLRDANGPFRDTIAALRAAATEWGFFYITNHGITSEQLEALQRSVRAFFALPKDVKNRIRRKKDNARGYFDGELTKNKPDWKEVFDLTGPHEDTPPNPELYKRIANDQNQWLDEVTLPGFKQTINEHFSSARHIARRLLNLFAVTLGEKIDFFDQFFPDITPEDYATGQKQRFSTSTMRLNHYPVAPEPENTMGVYHHTDPGAVTVLLQDDQVASLQVFHRGSQQWLFVPPIKDTFVVNIGDMVQIWSNDKFVAPLHRVVASGSKGRFSVPFFHNPSYDTVVKPVIVDANEKPKYKPLSWRHFRSERVAGNYADLGVEIQISQYRINGDDE